LSGLRGLLSANGWRQNRFDHEGGQIRRFGRTLFFDTNSAARTRAGHVENEARKEYARAHDEQ
jgi:hypothetical protein